MKILQLFSDWKWTGPAEPVVSLCEVMNAQGIDVTLAYRKTPLEFRERTVEKQVKQRAMRYYDGLRLNRYFSFRDWSYDMQHLKDYVGREKIDIIHTNLSHDHYTAVIAMLFAGMRPLIVRTDHKRDGMPDNLFMSWALRRTDGIVTYSERLRRQDVKRFDFPDERTSVITPAIKLYDGPVRDMRDELGIRPGERVIGVIGRLKPDRGYEIILRAFKKVKDRQDGVRLLVMGRSSQIEKSIKRPLAELGIEQDVILAGYRVEDYFSVIATFDIFIIMRAGSDGSARALREVMGMGRPAIVSDAGMLPELVDNGKTGFVTTWDENDLSKKMEALLQDEGMRKTFGANAAKTAKEKWDYRAQAGQLRNFYERLMRMGKRK
ncbi:MAG: Spore coat protein SA [Syntrophorhabdus sp. PtaU1.Bin058]|nr:MAG: Spore coat protein SA [Syntrophorhabdus sp. PtaU1.Bin058]